MSDETENFELDPESAPAGTILIRKNGVFVKGEDGLWVRDEEASKAQSEAK
jgi:hypothetical protein